MHAQDSARTMMELLLATPQNPGWTYFITAKPYDGWAKIGRTTRATDVRLAGLQTGNPRPLVVRAQIPIDIEWHLHTFYSEFRGHGEWFALPLELIRYAARQRPLPLHALMETWPPHAVLDAAGGGLHVAGRTERLARAFATRAHIDTLPDAGPPPRGRLVGDPARRGRRSGI